jgi:putative transposase
VRDENDLQKHLDYIHYNPVKHGLARTAIDYSHSSFAKYQADGYYSDDWGVRDVDFDEGSFGE